MTAPAALFGSMAFFIVATKDNRYRVEAISVRRSKKPPVPVHLGTYPTKEQAAARIEAIEQEWLMRQL